MRSQAPALDVSHRDPGDALVLAEVVDGADPRVIESRRGLGLPQEPLARVLVDAESGGEELQRDLAAQTRVLGEEHDALAAATDLSKGSVAADSR